MSIETLQLRSLPQWLAGKADWLLFSMSYESRSPIIRTSLRKSSVRFMGFHNANHIYNSDALKKAQEEVGGLVAVPLNSDAPLLSLDAMREAISFHIAGTVPTSVVVDITCFTRESLAMLMMTLKHLLPAGCRIHCLYNMASSYGDSPNDREHHGWLTRGIVGFRSILGYRGRVRLIADTHLILLPGFEAERAHGIIDELQPNRLTIGQIELGESIRPEFAPVVGAMNQRLLNFYPDRNITNFAFSSRDPIITKRGVLGCVVESENTVVACLNTKLAMMGVIMAALSNRNIQLVYAQPKQYNLKGLSVPGDEVIAFEVP
jgi:hypothetical protein